MLNVLLIDDHELFRAGIKLLLAELSEEVVFAEAVDCPSALALAGSRSFEVVLLDLHMPGMGGLDALPLLHEAFKQAAVIVLSGEDDPALIRHSIERGASGFIPKTSTPRVMVAALRLVLAGGCYLPPHVLSSHAVSATLPPLALQSDPQNLHANGLISQLTDRQTQTLRQAMQGKPNKIIAREMAISEATVKAHLATAFRVLGVKNRTEAVFAAARAGLTV